MLDAVTESKVHENANWQVVIFYLSTVHATLDGILLVQPGTMMTEFPGMQTR